MDTNMNDTEGRESGGVNLSSLWSIFKRCWYAVLLIGIAVGLVAGSIASYLYVPRYAASVSFLMKVDSNFQTQFQNTDINDSIVHTYEVAFRYNRDFCIRLNEFAHTDRMGYTEEDVAEMMSCEQILPNTPTLKVTFTCSNPDAAYRLANALSDNANGELSSQFGSTLDAVDIFNTPEKPTEPVTHNPFLKLFAIGFLVGALAVYLIFLLSALNDKRIHGEKSMEEFSEYPILGIVPTLSGARGSDKGTGRTGER